MLSEDEEKQAEIDALKGKLARLGEREASLEQICILKSQVSKAWRMGDIAEAQKLYNQMWEIERKQKNHSNQKENRQLTKEDILKLAGSMGLRKR